MTSGNIALRFVKKRHDFLTEWPSKHIWLKIAAFFNRMEFLVTHAVRMTFGGNPRGGRSPGGGGASGGMVAHDLVNGWQAPA